MQYINLDTWNRKQHFEHFHQFLDPYFAITVNLEVTTAYHSAKTTGNSFFAFYLFACMKAINTVENFRYRIYDDKIAIHDVIHASATIAREDNTFGCTFIHFDNDFKIFNQNLQKEKKRVQTSKDLFPPINTIDCIYCSSLPWFSFSGHKEPLLGVKESVPKLAFGKFTKANNKLLMPVSVAANHALVDGYHMGLFFKNYQKELNKLG